jgi:uncharacterized membrane protein YeaQ/YmgE (transglycosylase-associated protein family)
MLFSLAILSASLHPVSATGGKTMVDLVIQMVSGALAGNGAGALLKKLSLGTIGNSIAGILGGGIGGQLLGLLALAPAATASGPDAGSIVASVLCGGAGGAVLVAVSGAVKKALGK